MDFVFYSVLKVATWNDYEVFEAIHFVGQETFQRILSTNDRRTYVTHCVKMNKVKS